VTQSSAGDVQVVTIESDGSVGPSVDRLLAHQAPGILHLAVSVALVDTAGLWLLQRRAASKMAFAGGWANSCCTHPRPGEELAAAALRRVSQELGLELGGLEPAGTFTYQATDPVSGLVEYEFDHVFVALTDTTAAVPDPDEIGALARLPLADALELVASEGGTPWASEVLRLASRRVS
jgi:isopentenyl-diphosphate delta-isomerase